MRHSVSTDAYSRCTTAPWRMIAVRMLHSAIVALTVLGHVSLALGTDSPEDIEFFEKRIRPVLVAHCYSCHSAAAGKSEGGLQLDSRDGVRTGGERGSAVVPGKPAMSWLLKAIEQTDASLRMPPEKAKLPATVIADIRLWIERGGADPRERPVAGAERPPIDLESGRAFWSLRKPQRTEPPTVSDALWSESPIDRWIRARLERENLPSSPEADAVTLLRRLSFDLIGLPPSHDEVVAFSNSWKTANAANRERIWAATVDRLLASPRYGERWGRHWLDVARFAESTGRESNLTFPHAWRYRDYVIDAFQADLPYNRFLTEQLAGDLLPAKEPAERARLLIATGFLAFGTKGLNEMNRAQFDADVVDEQIDTVTRALLASSVACARCHDHKFDPYHMEDYYALAGIFQSTKTCFGSSINSESSVASDLVRLPNLPGQLIPNKSIPPERVTAMKSQIAQLNDEERRGRAAVEKALAEGRNAESAFTLTDALRIYWTRGILEGELKQVDADGKALPLCMGTLDAERIADARLLERGEISHPKQTVRRGFPRVIALPGVAAPPENASGRLQLAQWITHVDNPLTARVLVNRVWRQLFGTGLVRTVDNFGFTGERPSHPELLDHLAVRFVEQGWSIKSVIREIVLSRTYRQSTQSRPDGLTADPGNRLLWRMSRRRLDAEAIRDAMLFVSGELDVSRRPGSLIAEIGDKSVSLFGFTKTIPPDLDGSLRRSVYLPVVRDRLPDVLELFDGAEPSLVTGDRDTTNVPVQALYLMNSPFVRARAQGLALRLVEKTEGADSATDAARVRRAFALCFHRSPDTRDSELAERFLKRTDGREGAADRWVMFCQALLATAEFRNLD